MGLPQRCYCGDFNCEGEDEALRRSCFFFRSPMEIACFRFSKIEFAPPVTLSLAPVRPRAPRQPPTGT
jgi:hypothetical protein